MTGELLKEHFSRYPGMELQDAVKLLYQSEFGGGHMIADPEASLRRLEEEYGTFHEGSQISEIKPGEKILWEPAGKGMARIYLDAMDAGLSARTLNAMFVRSAETAAGKPEAFRKAWKSWPPSAERERCLLVERRLSSISGSTAAWDARF